MLRSTVLLDPAYRMPTPEAGAHGMGWLRSHIARFADGTDHARMRAAVEDQLDRLDVDPYPGEDPTDCLLRSLGLPRSLAHQVASIAAAYHPHQPTTTEADEAVERFVTEFDERSERVAATICLLVQAHAGTRALIDALEAGDGRAPVPMTRRVAPDGTVVEVDLADAHFGRGPHACPGEAIARRLAAAALT
ncbi:hypothetical protein MU582_00365 [Nocardioidaceae bacterium SCSIO 66511]|nr:hypothetical protein MU582_00365 [Nocardioidaceae bacterium SCSIO 66511]